MIYKDITTIYHVIMSVNDLIVNDMKVIMKWTFRCFIWFIFEYILYVGDLYSNNMSWYQETKNTKGYGYLC